MVVAGLGALAEGYVLIIPKSHRISVAKLPIPIVDEVVKLKTQSRIILEATYGSAVFFEHGAATERKNGGACIDHVHIHAFPCEFDLRPSLREHFPEVPLNSLYDLLEYSNSKRPYLFYEDQLGEMFLYWTPDKIPSQFVRRIWATALGVPDRWDWGLFMNELNVAKTINVLKARFDNGGNSTTIRP